MTEFLKVLLSLSISGSFLIVLLLIFSHVWKHRISRQWQYYIWLIAIARLLLPFAPEQNFMTSLFQTAEQSFVQMAEQNFPQTAEQNFLQTAEQSFFRTAEQDFMQTNSEFYPWENQKAAGAATLVWLMVALGLMIRKITLYQSFVRYGKAGQMFVSDVERLDQLSILAARAGVKRPVELCVNPLMSSPLLTGFFRPCIILPDANISETDFQYTALHELIHYRRKDFLFQWLVQAAVCLHWFNPLVYAMARAVDHAREFSCDEAIVRNLDAAGRKAYGQTLLNAMKHAGTYRESLAAVTLTENKHILKERLGAIMKFKKQSKLTTVCSFFLTVALLCTATFTGAYAATDTDPAADTGTAVISLNSNGQNCLIHSSSFEARDGQVLTLEVTSNISGTVDLFLFSPTFQEQRITLGGQDDIKTVALSEGTWAYNCTGFFDSGDISIVGTVE